METQVVVDLDPRGDVVMRLHDLTQTEQEALLDAVHHVLLRSRGNVTVREIRPAPRPARGKSGS